MNISVERTWSTYPGSFLKSIERSFAPCSTGIAYARCPKSPIHRRRCVIACVCSATEAKLLCGRRKRAMWASISSFLFFLSHWYCLAIFVSGNNNAVRGPCAHFRMSSTKRNRVSLSDKLKIIQRLDILGYIRKLWDFVSQQQAVLEAVHRSVDSLDTFVSSSALRVPD